MYYKVITDEMISEIMDKDKMLLQCLFLSCNICVFRYTLRENWIWYVASQQCLGCSTST